MKSEKLEVKTVKEIDKVSSEFFNTKGITEWLKFKNSKWVSEDSLKKCCKFYLKYRNKPVLLVRNYKDYEYILWKFAIDSDKYDYNSYNEWLFKIAFADIVGGNDETKIKS